jgi:hypothetical protein
MILVVAILTPVLQCWIVDGAGVLHIVVPTMRDECQVAKGLVMRSNFAFAPVMVLPGLSIATWLLAKEIKNVYYHFGDTVRPGAK